MNLNSIESISMPKFNYRDLIIFLVPILIFMLYLSAYKPGVLTVASYSQLHQIATDKFTTAYPMFHTYLVMIFLKIFKSVFFMNVFQILVFAVMWTVICKYHRNDASKSSNEFVLQFIVTLIICLIPINAVYSITLSSNVLFSYSLVFLCFLIKVLIDRDGLIDTKLAALIAVTLALMCGLNNYGIAIAIISLAAIAFYMYRNNTPQDKMVMLIGLSVLCILLISSFSLIYEVKGSNYDTYTSLVNIPSNDAFEDGVNLESARNQFFSSTNYEPKEPYENVVSESIGSGKYAIVDSFVNLFRESFILDALFNNPILYLILSVFLLGFVYLTLQQESVLIMFIPVLANTLIVVITGVNNLYSNLLFFYLILICSISLFFNMNMKPQDISTLAKGGEQRRLTRPQQQQTYEYIEPQQEYYEDDYSYIESEIENLTMEDIQEMLGETPTTEEIPKQDYSQPSEDSDLIDEILKELENDKK